MADDRSPDGHAEDLPLAHPVLHLDRPLLDVDLDYVGGRASLIGHTDDELPSADAAIIGIAHRWDAARFARFPNLRVVSRMGVGYDNVDVVAARAAGVVVCNAPDSPTVSTAEHTMALLLAVTKELPRLHRRAQDGLTGPGVATSLELDGARLGLVGIGRIGVRVARAALALGMDVVAFDPGLTESPLDGVTMVDLDEALTTSHVVSLHAPATPDTLHLINRESLASMRPGVYVVNCARGALVDHDALLEAIDSGQVAGAGLDVTDPEPLPAGHPLLDRENVIVTPHIASSTAIGRRRLFEHAIENALDVLAGRPASVVT